ncbi:hypothetical protein [Rhizobium tubonense]|uniref:DUF1127 domain-containing protein n=1 Tax=Rhizobium tubonense TaxID=484088 RepID=A0A2W4ESD2_9HYPH|nr:hypothetical protein [Rhizobium tubonense]PZM13883.1 hypothetical protein CPY51_13555 [Rhizobium tubonense]
MDICAIEQAAAVTPPARLPVLKAIFAFLTRRRLSVGKLDLDAMPDRVKRDLGFLDGRGPRYEDERMR